MTDTICAALIGAAVWHEWPHLSEWKQRYLIVALLVLAALFIYVLIATRREERWKRSSSI
jgi:membrane protein DedA with SNARE-associated domain